MGRVLQKGTEMRFVYPILFIIVSVGLILTSCSKTSTEDQNSLTFSKDQLLTAFRSVALRTTLVLPDSNDIDALVSATNPKPVYDSLVDNYVTGEGLRASLTNFYREMFGMGGNGDQDDPVRLAVYIIMSDLSYQQLVTANYKIDQNYLKVAQDSGAPPEVQGGFMTLGSWLRQYTGNSSSLFHYVREVAFLTECYKYPDPDTTLYYWTDADLAPKYHENNGIACNQCHRTMNVRRSVWYKFDANGTYDANRSPSNMYGHEPPPGAGGTEIVEPRAGGEFKFVDTIASPADYGKQISEHPRFAQCTAQRFLAFALGYDNGRPGQSGRLPFDFAASSHPGDPKLLATWTDHLKNANNFKIRPFLRDFFKSNEFIARVNNL